MASGEPGALLVIETLPEAAPVPVGAYFAVNDVLCPAVSVIAVSPLMLKPVPVADPPEIATLAVPVLERVIGTDPLLPTTRLPKFTLAGLAVRCPCVPVPLNAIVKVGFVALLVTVTEPEAIPVDAGAKFAVNDVLWPAFRVTGLNPLMLKPVPVAAACEMAILVAPLFVSEIDWVLLLPTVTLPNAKLPGFAFNVELAEVPVPARSSICGESGELLVNLMLPVIPCADGGVKLTIKDALWPAWSVEGSARPLIPKPPPETCARFTIRSTFPLFVSFSVCVLLCPTFTLPKDMLEGDIVKPACVPVPVNEMLSGEFVASLTIEKVPLSTPAEVGAS